MTFIGSRLTIRGRRIRLTDLCMSNSVRSVRSVLTFKELRELQSTEMAD